MSEIYFEGTIDKVIYQNESNFFKILSIEIENTNAANFKEDYIVATGEFANIVEGDSYRIYGELVTHPKYDLQLKANRYEKSQLNEKGLVNYFSSGRFKGIGKAKAKSIVSLFGKNAVEEILENPSKLIAVGLSEKVRNNLVEVLKNDQRTESTLSQLYELGVPHALCLRIESEYKEEAVKQMKENPYLYVREIKGFSFKMADAVGENLGIAVDSPMRINAGITQSLYEQCHRTGDTYVTRDDLITVATNLLQSARSTSKIEELITSELDKLIDEDVVVEIDNRIFTNGFYYAEQGIANNIKRLIKKGNIKKYDLDEINELISEYEATENVKYDDIQRQAIIEAITNPFFILTGGPGTGKTTVIKCIINVYSKLNNLRIVPNDEEGPILLAAPTGRAARRMNELTHLYAATLHRHLGLPDNYIDEDLVADLIIVDEFSMVDTWMANKLFHKIDDNTQVLIVGDAGQLPSVSPGNVLEDLLKVPMIPNKTLEKVYRQSDDSTIVSMASDIRKGILSDDFRDKKPDRSYLEVPKDGISEVVGKIVKSALNSGVHASQIQILAPMYKGEGGINNLNKVVQELLNPSEIGELEFFYINQIFRKNDRVIHLENKPDLNVFNGDLGYIVELIPASKSESKQEELVMDFDGSKVVYPRSDWTNISLAYAMSIHKSQGSEFPVVIIPITYANYPMLQRNLIYTGITRAKSKLILLGEIKAFSYAIEHVGVDRKTYLVERFK